MAKNGLVSRLKRTLAYAGLLGALSLGANCDGPVVPPVNKYPVADGTYAPAQGYFPLPVTFDGTASYDTDGSIKKHIWNFGNGVKDSTSGAMASYTYTVPGTYSDSLTVVDNDGARTSKYLGDVVVMQIPPPQTTLSAVPDSGFVPLNSRIKYACTTIGGLENIAQSYLVVGTDIIQTTSIDSTFVFTQPGTYTAGAYCRNKTGGESRAGPINIKAKRAPIQIAFYSTRETNGGHIYLGGITKTPVGRDTLINILGLTGSGEKYADYESSWSPDGKSLVFVSNRDGPTALFTITYANGIWTQPMRISPNITLATSPYWCSNNKIVFTFVNSGMTGVASQTSDGTGYQTLYSEPGNTTTPWAYPTCSSDGKTIAFGADSSGNWEIYTMDETGKILDRLTTSSAVDIGPIYLPNDSQMIFTSTRSGAWKNYIMNIRDKSTNLFFDGLDFKPSQDGERFIFADSKGWCNNGGDALVADNQIYTAGFDGKNLSNIEQLTFSGTSTSGLCSVSRWALFRPIPK